MKKVSIIIPVYNHEKYIEQCIDSVFCQNYSNCEVIIIDDGSKDNSLKILKKICGKNKNTKIISQSNMGAYATINKGLKLSSGKYINILNSDDYFSKNRISRFIEIIEDKKAEMAFSKVVFVDGESKDITCTDEYAIKTSKTQENISNFASVGFSLMLTNVGISTGNFFFTRELYEKVGEFSNLQYVHDWDFILRCLYFTEPVFIDEPHYFYRLHEKNSFKSLAHVAGTECTWLMRNYFKSVKTGFPENHLAPCNENWPYYFNYFINKNNYWVYVNIENK